MSHSHLKRNIIVVTSCIGSKKLANLNKWVPITLGFSYEDANGFTNLHLWLIGGPWNFRIPTLDAINCFAICTYSSSIAVTCIFSWKPEAMNATMFWNIFSTTACIVVLLEPSGILFFAYFQQQADIFESIFARFFASIQRFCYITTC